MVTQGIEHVFGTVTGIDQRVYIQKSSAAFNRVEATENSIQQVGILRIIFQLYQLFR